MSKRTAHASGATFYSGRLHAVCSESASQSCCRVYRGRNQLVTMCVPRRERQTLADLARHGFEEAVEIGEASLHDVTHQTSGRIMVRRGSRGRLN